MVLAQHPPTGKWSWSPAAAQYMYMCMMCSGKLLRECLLMILITYQFLTRSDWGFLIGLSLLGNCNVFIHTLRFKCASKTHIHEQPNFPNVPSVERGCLHTCARTRDAPPDMTC